MVNSRYSGPPPPDPDNRWTGRAPSAGRHSGPFDVPPQQPSSYSRHSGYPGSGGSGPYGDPGQSGPQRSGGHRRQKRGGRVAIAGAVAGVIAIAAVVGGIILSQSGSKSSPTAAANGGSATVVGGDVPRIEQPKTGTPLNIATPDGYAYTVAAISGGTSDQPLVKDVSPPASGQTFAYIDYVLTNSKQTPALLDFPADLFLKAAKVPGAEQTTCMPQPGIPGDMCTLRNHSLVTAYVGDSKAPITQNGDQYMPGGASYRIRIQTDLSVDKGLAQSDMGLYVWDIRYISNGKGVHAAFP